MLMQGEDLRQTEYANYVKLKRTEREIVIKYTGKIKIDPVKDVILEVNIDLVN